MKKIIWISWLMITAALGTYYYFNLFINEDKSDFLIGETSYGHYQIEMECSACHTDAFGGQEVLQDACTNCHADELEAAHDSHPKKKFTDPRDAYRLEIVDARYCVSCHTEHNKEKTHPMGVTLPDDYCWHCHKEVGEERESHAGLAFDSCASAGCHNYHDNRALYEDFLVKNAGQPWLSEVATIAPANHAATQAIKKVKPVNQDWTEKMRANPEHTADWQVSAHARVNVGCGSCHTESSSPSIWIDKPKEEQCESCHAPEVKSFTQGKHGMRLAEAHSRYAHNITPGESGLRFREDSLDVQHGCNSCHGAHSFDTKKASVESCLNCHADDHAISFKDSPHGKLWLQSEAGEIKNSAAVTCATCHMPRSEKTLAGQKVISVNHNQNDNLRPNEKMIRPVCMQCHGLEFSIDALADPKLIESNFNGKPGTHIESVDWSLKRVKD